MLLLFVSRFSIAEHSLRAFIAIVELFRLKKADLILWSAVFSCYYTTHNFCMLQKKYIHAWMKTMAKINFLFISWAIDKYQIVFKDKISPQFAYTVTHSLWVWNCSLCRCNALTLQWVYKITFVSRRLCQICFCLNFIFQWEKSLENLNSARFFSLFKSLPPLGEWTHTKKMEKYIVWINASTPFILIYYFCILPNSGCFMRVWRLILIFFLFS